MKHISKRTHFITPVFEYRPELDHVTAIVSFDPLPRGEAWECAIAARENAESWSFFRYSRPVTPGSPWELEIERVHAKFKPGQIETMLKTWINSDELSEEDMKDLFAYRNRRRAPLLFRARRTHSPEPSATLIPQRGFAPSFYERLGFIPLGNEERKPPQLPSEKANTGILGAAQRARLNEEWQRALATGVFVTKSYRNAGMINTLGSRLEFPTVENGENFEAALGLQVKADRLELTRYFRANAGGGEWQEQKIDAGEKEQLIAMLCLVRDWCRAAIRQGRGTIEAGLLPEARLINQNTPIPEV